MHDPVIILAPPRSFTSIVCGMLGQHPQLYGLPEVNLFVAETMREREGVLAQRRFSEHGLLRVVAQLFAGEQTIQTIGLARRWVAMRAHRTCVSVFRELAERVSPRILVDKSPMTVLRPEYLQRIRRAFPNARFLHLLRHPRTQGDSLWRIGGPLAGWRLEALDYSTDPPTVDFQKAWYTMHMTILTFLEGVPKAQQLRVRGEDLLADPDAHLQQIAAWLGIRTDPEAIEAMKHPERSPYACLGPLNAPFGNDPQFLRAPALRRPSAPLSASLEGPLPWRHDGQGFSPEVKALAREFGYQ
ncbi:MAG: sulfotransferase family protein [Candidatus Tectimicrobiota bacterium]|nr:MAG: sulfotransferase family protein [Candidatus Tectomicrobia bacterium]